MRSDRVSPISAGRLPRIHLLVVLLHPLAVGVAHPLIGLRQDIPLLGRLAIQSHYLDIIFWQALAVFIHLPQVDEGMTKGYWIFLRTPFVSMSSTILFAP